VREDEAVDWRRRDYDAYGRTKKLAEHLVRELLAGVAPVTVLRPSIVLGDSRRPETTQFDMVRAFSFLAALPVLPLRATDRIDVVPANWVARAAVTLHRAESPAHAVYHLSAGEASPAYRELTDAIAAALDGRAPFYAPGLARPASAAAWALERLGPRAVRRAAALFRVFLPYLTYDTVFANERAVPEVGAAPTPFPEWAVPLLEWSRRHRFTYPYTPWPGDAEVPPESVPADPVGSAAS
jgi:nucleoside-diphosphate-sugar epimerase